MWMEGRKASLSPRKGEEQQMLQTGFHNFFGGYLYEMKSLGIVLIVKISQIYLIFKQK